MLPWPATLARESLSRHIGDDTFLGLIEPVWGTKLSFTQRE